ncbi:hypothetical protein M8494_10375 [Serratia ureilytica]
MVQATEMHHQDVRWGFCVTTPWCCTSAGKRGNARATRFCTPGSAPCRHLFHLGKGDGQRHSAVGRRL